ncbi:MAG: hypothetical protein WCC64_16810 [Aliidongia sp.]
MIGKVSAAFRCGGSLDTRGRTAAPDNEPSEKRRRSHGRYLEIAYKLLANDRAKFAALLVAITFAVFLMIQMTSRFAGVLSRPRLLLTADRCVLVSH